MATAPEHVQRLVRVMARALGRAGLSNAYGHCSVRLDAEYFLVCAARPMGTILPGEPGTEVPIEGPLPPGVLGEVRLHQQIYRRRPDIGAVCRFLSPNVLTLGSLGRSLRSRNGFGSYFHPEAPFWTDARLVRNDQLAEGAIACMGQSPALILNVNGAVVAAQTPARALALAWNLEEAARVELAVLQAGLEDRAPVLSDETARARAIWDGAIAERMWDYLTDGDPEASGLHAATASA